MARISTYALDSNVTKNDKVIGTDSAGTQTRNYKISAITSFLNKSSSVETTGSRFTFVRPSNTTKTYGYIKLPVDQGATVAFSTISSIQLHKKAASDVDINTYYEAIEGSLVLLQKADDPTHFGVFEWTTSTQNSSNTDVYDITVKFKGGNGSLQDEEDLKIRGPGEILGKRQSGLPSFNVADLSFDGDLLEEAKLNAEKIINIDPK